MKGKENAERRARKSRNLVNAEGEPSSAAKGYNKKEMPEVVYLIYLYISVAHFLWFFLSNVLCSSCFFVIMNRALGGRSQ